MVFDSNYHQKLWHLNGLPVAILKRNFDKTISICMYVYVCVYMCVCMHPHVYVWCVCVFMWKTEGGVIRKLWTRQIKITVCMTQKTGIKHLEVSAIPFTMLGRRHQYHWLAKVNKIKRITVCHSPLLSNKHDNSSSQAFTASIRYFNFQISTIHYGNLH